MLVYIFDFIVAPIPSASGLGVGFRYLNTYSVRDLSVHNFFMKSLPGMRIS